jgi:hypothetical protein
MAIAEGHSQGFLKSSGMYSISSKPQDANIKDIVKEAYSFF